MITNWEIAEWFKAKHSVEDVVAMNIGGSYETKDVLLRMVPAIHSSGLPDGSYGGTAAGFVMKIRDRRFYFACDTALFSDMKWHAGGCDVAVVPIGDRFTMGVHDSIEAVKIFEPRHVLPTHYNTWPPIEQDAAAWATKIRSESDAKPVVLGVGESFEI